MIQFGPVSTLPDLEDQIGQHPEQNTGPIGSCPGYAQLQQQKYRGNHHKSPELIQSFLALDPEILDPLAHILQRSGAQFPDLVLPGPDQAKLGFGLQEGEDKPHQEHASHLCFGAGGKHTVYIEHQCQRRKQLHQNQRLHRAELPAQNHQPILKILSHIAPSCRPASLPPPARVYENIPDNVLNASFSTRYQTESCFISPAPSCVWLLNI